MQTGYHADEKATLESALQKEQQGIKPVKNYAAAFKYRSGHFIMPAVLLCGVLVCMAL